MIAAFDELRPLLFSIAYRLLGSVSDAEDVVHDAYLRWERVDPSEVRSPKDFLSTTVTRLAIDHLRSARARREVYVGPWLPEPLVGVDDRDPIAAIDVAESISLAFLVLLERLTPMQRAGFLLRQVFDFEYAEVARMLETSEANARQLVQRAKRMIAEGQPRFEADAKANSELVERFLTACTTGDLDGLVSMLTEDAVAYADGGGKFAAARRPVVGADRVARFLVSIAAKWRSSGELRVAPVNAMPGLLFYVDGRVRGVLSLGADAKGIRQAFIVMNPDKLGAV